MARRCLALALALAALTQPARATEILDTYPADGGGWKPIAIAVPFRAPDERSEVSEIDAALHGSAGTIEIGIMTDQGGLPSNRFLFSRIVTPSLATDVVLRDLDWTLPAHAPLWLAVLESPTFSFGDGYWQANGGLDRPWAFKATLDGAWFGYPFQTPAARIEVEERENPEPARAWLAAALLLAGAAVARRTATGR